METNTSGMINLNGSNYQLWKTRMEDLLYVNGFHEPIVCSERPRDKTNEEWNLLHRRVCGYIRQWVDDSLLNHVSGEIDACTLWKKLGHLCAQKTCHSKLYLIKQLMGLRYHDGTAMLDHLNIFQGIINRLSETGIKIDDEVQGLWLLGTLPDSWEALGTMPLLISTPDGIISVEMVKNSVLNEELRRKSLGSTLCSNTLAVAATHQYTLIKVVREENLREQIGKDIFFDLVDQDKVYSFRVQHQIPLSLFKEEVAKEFGIPVHCQRFWLWTNRKNQTYRPSRPLTPQEEAQPVEVLRKKANNAELKLFLEDSRPVPPPAKTENDILLFFMLYDPSKEVLRYVGRLFVKDTGKPKEIVTKLNELAGFAPGQDIQLFEEIKFEPTVICELVDRERTYRASQVVRFRPLVKPKKDEFSLELPKLSKYYEIVERVASHLNLDDPSKIRLTSHKCYSQQPKPQPIKYRGVEHLSDILARYNQTSDILYYEVLDIPLPEMQGLKTLKVAFYQATKDEVVMHTIRLPKQSTVGEVINVLKTKVELSHKDVELRLLQVFCHKIYKTFSIYEKIENINDQYWTLRAEEIPEEEKDLGPQDRLIHVYHFTKGTSQNLQVQNFGEPFFLVIREGETVAEVKPRIQKKLQVPDEEFSKWKFAFVYLGRVTYLQDSDVVSTCCQKRDCYGDWDQYLGLEHSDKTSKGSYAVNQN